MKNIVKKISAVLILLSAMVGVGYSANYAAATLTFVQTPTISLYASISGSATSMRITPYPKDLDGNKLTMTDFGTNPTVTIDPKVRNVEEIVGFTGIVDNGDNTATLTGLTRDLASKAPYVTSGTGRSHSASAIVVFSNNPQMYNRLAAPENTEVITNAWTFSILPTFTNPPVNGTDGVNKAYVDSGVLQGAATSTESNMGIVQLATALQTAAGTASSTQGRPLVIKNSVATSTYNAATSANVIPVTNGSGQISSLFIATSSNYVWSGNNRYTGSSTMATTSIAASGTSTSPLILNGVPYAFPATQGASSSSLRTDGNGNLLWVSGSPRLVLYDNSGSASVTTGSTQTSTSTSVLQIPAGFLTASSTITATGVFTCSSGSGGTPVANFELRTTTGQSLASVAATCPTTITTTGSLNFSIVNFPPIEKSLSMLQGQQTSSFNDSYFYANGTGPTFNMSSAFGIQAVLSGSFSGGNTMSAQISTLIITVNP